MRLLPLRLPHADEDAIEMVLQAVLPFDGPLFSGRSGDTDSRLYGQVPHPRTAGPRALVRSVDHAHGIGGPSDASSALGPVVEQSD